MEFPVVCICICPHQASVLNMHNALLSLSRDFYSAEQSGVAGKQTKSIQNKIAGQVGSKSVPGQESKESDRQTVSAV